MNIARYTKIIFWLTASILLIISLMLTSQYFLNQYLIKNRVSIEQLVAQKIGMPVSFQSLHSRWHFLSMGIILDNVQMDAPKEISGTTNPIATMDSIELRANPYKLFVEKKFSFHQVVLRGLKLALSWDEQKGLEVLGLNTENTKSNPNPLQFLAIENLSLKQAQIVWKRKGSEILQRLNGKFKADHANNTIRFVGKQELNFITEDPTTEVNRVFTLPTRPLAFTLNTEKKALELTTELFGINIDCRAQSQDKTYLQCALQGKNINLTTIRQQIHLQPTDPPWIRWLFTALEKGKINQLNLKMLGFVNDFKTEGKILFSSVDFLFHPQWPKIQNANGELVLVNEVATIKVDEGRMNGAMMGGSAKIGPFKEKNARIDISGHAIGTLEQGLEVLKQSPISDLVASKIAILNPHGPMDLKLHLDLPLFAKNDGGNDLKSDIRSDIKVDGQLKTNNAELFLKEIDLPINNFSGEFEFTDQKINAKTLKANIQEKPFTGLIEDNKVMIQGMINTDFIEKHFQNPLLKRINGESLFNISYLNGYWQCASDLEGITIDLPEPIGKEKAKKVPLSFSIFPMNKEEQKVSLNLKDVLDAKLVLNTQTEPYQLKRGHVVFAGMADWTNKRSLMIGGDLKQINVKDWWEFFEQQSGTFNQLPLSIHLLVNNLEFMGMNFRNTWLDFTASKGGMAWILDGPMIKGTLRIPSSKTDEFKFALDLLKISIDPNNEKAFNDFISQDKRPISFFCHELIVGEKNFGQVHFKLQPKEQGYDIQELGIKTEAYTLGGHGFWQVDGEEPKTFLSGDVQSKNIGLAFSQWGYSSAIKEARGQIQFDFQWPNSPIKFSLKDVQGSAIIHLRNGRILGVNPGLGKILGLLSLEKIPQRLFLDFSDLYKEGFAFDNLDGKLTLAKGNAYTESMTINGPQADIYFSGKADLSTKAVDLYMAVHPKMSEGLPIAAGLATGNPAIGLGVWAFSKIVGPKMDPIGAMTKHNYHVTGTWDAPHLQKMGDVRRSSRQNQ